jgi:hypothetical protein
MATGEFVALLDHDDALVPTARIGDGRPRRLGADIDYVYTDERT